MPNQLYNMMNPNNGNFYQRLMQFRQNLNGDPNQQLQQMLNSGRISQQQYNNAVRQVQQIMNNGHMVQQLRNMLGM